MHTFLYAFNIKFNLYLSSFYDHKSVKELKEYLSYIKIYENITKKSWIWNLTEWKHGGKTIYHFISHNNHFNTFIGISYHSVLSIKFTQINNLDFSYFFINVWKLVWKTTLMFKTLLINLKKHVLFLILK